MSDQGWQEEQRQIAEDWVPIYASTLPAYGKPKQRWFFNNIRWVIRTFRGWRR